MNTKHKYVAVAIVSILSLLGGLIVGFKSQPAVTHAIWVDQAFTVAEVSKSADLIVRVYETEAETRELKSVLPYYADDQKTIDGYKEFIDYFTDSKMQVLEIYKGTADEYITVMQTGGAPSVTDSDVKITPSIEGDPIFAAGSEHILFLVDITDDGVQSTTGRKLYRIVNPLGRYEIKDGNLITPSSYISLDESDALKLPKSLDELIEQIKLSLIEK